MAGESLSQDIPHGLGSQFSIEEYSYFPVTLASEFPLDATSSDLDHFPTDTESSFSPLTSMALGYGTPIMSIADESITSTSPSSYNGNMYDMPSEFQESAGLERSLSGLESNNFDDSSLHSTSFNFSGKVHNLSHMYAAKLENQNFDTSRPIMNDTRLSIDSSSGSASASFPNAQPIQDQFTSTEDSMDGSPSPGSPGSSNGPTECRTDERYHYGPASDGKFYCPFSDCASPPKTLKCEYHKHIDSHLKPFKCRNPACASLVFSSMACQLRHEREMHKMHDAKEHSCRFVGDCDRKIPGNGFARSFNRSDHEKRVHGMVPDSNTRSKNRSKNNGSSSTALMSAGRRASSTQMLSTYASLGGSSLDGSNLDGSTASSPSAGLSQGPRRSSDRTGLHSLPPSNGPEPPTPVSNHRPGSFMGYQSLSGAWPIEGHGRDSIPNGSNTTPPTDRRPSAPLPGIHKQRRRRAVSSSSVANHYSRKFEELRNLAANVPSTPDEIYLLELQSLMDEVRSLQPNTGI